jgi:hypothetical protein
MSDCGHEADIANVLRRVTAIGLDTLAVSVKCFARDDSGPIN